MGTKLRRAVGAFKDGAAVAVARISASPARLLVLRATTHADVPAAARRVEAVLLLAASSHPNATACLASLSRRLRRTHDPAVALKCLYLVHRLLDGGGGGGGFPRHALRRLLNLSAFRDAFVRAYALYLEERLDRAPPGGSLLDRIPHWQRLLDRALAMPASRSRVAQAALHAVARDTFETYADVREGVEVLLDGLLRMEEGASRREAYEVCAKASRQAEELADFYDACRVAGVLRWGEYPHVERVRGEVLSRVGEFVAAKGDSGGEKRKALELLLLPPPVDKGEWQLVLTETAEEIAREGSAGERGPAAEDGNPFL